MSEHAPPPDEPPRWLDSPGNVTRIFHALLIICGGLLVADLLYHKHSHFGFEDSFGFYALFGFAAYVSLVTSAKGLRKLVKRDEDYYD